MKYRKKPVVIEAKQWTGENFQEIIDWAEQKENTRAVGGDASKNELYIKTLEGEMTASCGDFIICGVQGELYPCKPDIFAATYEPVED